MCIECWWECLNEVQQDGLFLAGVSLGACWLVWGLVTMISWHADKHRPQGVQWLACVPFFVAVVIIVVTVLYGLYGAIACMI